MALQATTNLFGTVASDSTAANLITIASSVWVNLTINGTSGAARFTKNSSSPNVTTDSVISAGTGPQLIGFEPGGPPITSLCVYANGSETTLTYSISIIKRGTIASA